MSPLDSWNEGEAKRAIIAFVSSVLEQGASFVPPGERIATFDNDGTLWCEKPMNLQLQHGLAAIAKIAEARPEVRDRQPFKAVWEKDRAWLAKVAEDYANGDPSGFLAIAQGYAEAFAGTSVDDFETDAYDFLSDARDQRFDVPLMQLTYKPMLELVHYLQDNGFQVYITSGGGRDFVRAVSEEIYRIPASMVIGSGVATEYAPDWQGVGQVMRTAEIEQPIDEGPGKPVHIHRAIGRRPILAGGNANGDVDMLMYAQGRTGPTLGLLVHHDDAVREYAYDDGAQDALAHAADEGWLVVSMKDDWKVVFA